MGSIIAMPLAEVTVTIGRGPKETALIFYCVLFFFVLIYVSLYVFVPFLHNVSRETPPSELPRTFFLKFFWINVIPQCTYWSILLTVVFALELIHLTWYKLCDNFISGKWIKKTFQKIGKALAPVSFFNSRLPYKPGAIFVKKSLIYMIFIIINVVKMLDTTLCYRLERPSRSFLRAGKGGEKYKICKMRILPFTYGNVDLLAKLSAKAL